VETVYPGVVAMFAQGCAGNINSNPCGGTFEDVRRLGTMLAGEVIRARECAATSDEAQLSVADRACALPCADRRTWRRHGELEQLGLSPHPRRVAVSGQERYRRMTIDGCVS